MNEKNITLSETKERASEQDSNVYVLKKPFRRLAREYKKPLLWEPELPMLPHWE